MTDKRPAPFKVEWERALARRSKLPLPGIGFLMALATYASADGGSIHPSQARMADDLGVSVRTVGKWVRLGLDSGWLREDQRGIGFGDVSRPSVYSLTIPELVEQNQNDASGSGGGKNQNDCSGSDGGGRSNQNDASGSGWDQAARQAEPERSCATTGTIVQSNRNDLSSYQHRFNPSPTQQYSDTANRASQGAPEELTPEPESAAEESVTGEAGLGHFAARHKRARAKRAAAERPSAYRPRFTSD